MKKTLLVILALSLVLFSCGESSTDEEALSLLEKASENLSNAESYSVSGNIDFSMIDETTNISGNGELVANYIADPMALEMNLNVNVNFAGNAATVPVGIYMVTEEDGIMMYVNSSGYWFKTLTVPAAQIEEFKNQEKLSDKDFYENATKVTYGGTTKVNSKKYYTAILSFTDNTFPYILEKLQEMGASEIESFKNLQEDEIETLNTVMNGLSFKTYIDQETETVYGYEMDLGSQLKDILRKVMETQGAAQDVVDQIEKSTIEGKFLFTVDNINLVEAITLPEAAQNAMDVEDLNALSAN